MFLAKAFVLCCFCAVVRVEVSSPTFVRTPNCSEVNDDVDRLLNASNEYMKTHGWQPCIKGFKQDIPVKIFGFSLPSPVTLSVYSGSLKSLEMLTRSGDAIKCSSSIFDTLGGTLTYDSLELSYEYIKASFLSFEMEGKLSYVHTHPEANFVIAHGTEDCSLQSFGFQNSNKPGNYKITTDKAWQSWLVGKVLTRALMDQATSPCVFNFEKQYQWYVENFFSQYWCDSRIAKSFKYT